MDRGRRVSTAHVRPSVVAGELQVPASKSETHRALLLAALSSAPCSILRPLRSADTDATLRGLHQLGARLRSENGQVAAEPADLRPPGVAIDCGESRTTLSLLAAQAARLGHPAQLVRTGSLRSRPIEDLAGALRSFGASAHSEGPVLRVRGPLRPGSHRIGGPGSQPVSALLLALPLLETSSEITVAEPMHSRPYVALTASVARQFGLRIDEQAAPGATTWCVPGGQTPRGTAYRVGGDWSAAGVLFAAAAITHGSIRAAGLEADSAQPDRVVANHLESFGLRFNGPSASDAPTRLQSPGTIDVSQAPDLFPTLAALAAHSQGTTVFVGGSSLRGKESDRIAAMARGLAAFGVEAREKPDGLEVTGGEPKGAAVPSPDDHRVHMALCVAALGAQGKSRIESAQSVAKSWPSFHTDLASVGARMEVA